MVNTCHVTPLEEEGGGLSLSGDDGKGIISGNGSFSLTIIWNFLGREKNIVEQRDMENGLG